MTSAREHAEELLRSFNAIRSDSRWLVRAVYKSQAIQHSPAIARRCLALEEENERLRGALGFYSDTGRPGQYEIHESGGGGFLSSFFGWGDKARAALEAAPQEDVLLCGCSVRGEVVHARRKGSRGAVCGETNVNVVDEPWRRDSQYSCKRCLAALEAAPPPAAGEVQ